MTIKKHFYYDINGALIRTEEVEIDQTEANADTIESSVSQSLNDLRTIVNTTGTLTALQLSNAVRIIAKVLIRFGRHYFRRLDGVD